MSNSEPDVSRALNRTKFANLTLGNFYADPLRPRLPLHDSQHNLEESFTTMDTVWFDGRLADPIKQ